MTTASAITVRPPNTTTPFTSSAFIGIQPYKSIQPLTLLGIQFHTSSTFHKFQVRYLECMGQVSGMQLWIHDHNKSRGTVSMSTDWVGVLSMLGFPGFGWQVPLICRLKPQQNGQACTCRILILRVTMISISDLLSAFSSYMYVIFC